MFDKIFFGSGGFYALYNHLGSIKELHKEYNKTNSKLSRNIVYYGISAGAIASILCYLLLENLIIIDKLNDLMEHVNITSFNLTSIGIAVLDRLFDICPDDLHKRISNIIHIGVTTKNGYNHISQFTSNADLYNAVVCSSTVAGLSNYDSIINGDVCIDGVYSFKYEYIPVDAIIIDMRIFSVPITITIPPLIIQSMLVEMGKNTVIQYVNNRPVINDDNKNFKFAGMLDIRGWLFIHGLTYKNPIWKRHIELKTNSKMSDNVILRVGFFDVIDYIHYSILDHTH
jgi:hypothetical protein